MTGRNVLVLTLLVHDIGNGTCRKTVVCPRHKPCSGRRETCHGVFVRMALQSDSVTGSHVKGEDKLFLYVYNFANAFKKVRMSHLALRAGSALIMT